MKNKQNKQEQRKKFKEIFEELLDNDKQYEIAEEFAAIVLDRDVNVNSRVKAFDLILRILGEGGSIQADDLKDLSKNIVLKIE